MKNKLLVFLLLGISLLLLNSCTKIEATKDSAYFINLAYQISKGDIKNGAIIDLRPLQNSEDSNDYDHGHIHGSLSYDFNNQEESHFINWITGLKNKKCTILIIDSGHHEYQTICKYLKKAKYQKVICFELGYQKLKEDNTFSKKIEESTGTEDCGC